MPFGSLWIPVLVSSVAVFVVSAILHMVLKYHAADFRPLPDEEGARAALGKSAIPPGLYFVPHCTDMRATREPAMAEKWQKGPVAMIAVSPNGLPSMGKALGLWFLLTFVVSFVAAYVARHTLAPGADPLLVMRVTGTVAFAAYGLGQVTNSIWHAHPWPNTFRALFDALVYAGVTGLVFRLLFPAA